MSETSQLATTPDTAAAMIAPAARAPVWNLLIVDDEDQVHTVSKLALDEFAFSGRKLRFLHAHSAREAKELLRNHNDIALILLDVVMESDTAGLEVVEFVRNTLGNKFSRIILRTGQPGQAPEMEVITRYDINGYMHKTELTWERLYTAVYTSLSTYRDLIALDANRKGLEKIIESTAQLFEIHSIERFAQGVLEQLIALLFVESDALMLHTSGVAAAGRPPDEKYRIVAATGAFKGKIGQNACESLPQQVRDRIRAVKKSQGLVYGADHIVGLQPGPQDLVFYVAADTPLSLNDQHLLEVFYRNVGIAYANLCRLADVVKQAQ
jgi:CheY-like chemotaxis protein